MRKQHQSRKDIIAAALRAKLEGNGSETWHALAHEYAYLFWQAVLDSGRAPLKPLKSARPVVWFWNEVGELLLSQFTKSRSLRWAWQAAVFKAKTLWRSTDAVLDPADPLPFLGLHYMQVLMLSVLHRFKR